MDWLLDNDLYAYSDGWLNACMHCELPQPWGDAPPITEPSRSSDYMPPGGYGCVSCSDSDSGESYDVYDEEEDRLRFVACMAQEKAQFGF